MPLSDNFVKRQSDRLVLNNETFRMVGANIYYFAFSTEPDQIRLLDLASDFGFNVLRIWAFNDFINLPRNPIVPIDTHLCFQFLNPGASMPELREGGFGLEHLDRAIKLAGDRGIRLILTLTNHNPDYGGIPQYQRWLRFTDLNDFYRDAAAKAMFQNWVRGIVTRQNRQTNLSYADDPTILAWEIANEPRCLSDPSGTELLTAWLSDMSGFIRSIAPHQLIAAGDEGFFNHERAGNKWLFNGSCGVSTEDILGISDIDFGTFHMYPGQWAKHQDQWVFGQMWIQNHIEAARRASKPIILEEYGLPASAERNHVYQAWLQTIEQEDAAGDLVWMLGFPGQGDQYLLTTPDDAPAIRDHAHYATNLRATTQGSRLIL